MRQQHAASVDRTGHTIVSAMLQQSLAGTPLAALQAAVGADVCLAAACLRLQAAILIAPQAEAHVCLLCGVC